MHRLMSSTNRRMHKGFPEMLSYLLGKPMLYGSHTFGFRYAVSLVHHRVQGTTPDRPPAAGAAQHLDHTDATSSSRDAAPNGLLLRQPARLNVGDYQFRSEKLGRFPLYFFFAACEVTAQSGSRSLHWVELPGPGEGDSVMRQHSYQAQAMKSRAVPELELLTEDGDSICRYGYYLWLRTHEAWRVPIVHGRVPRVPEASATAYEKGLYALFAMMLFRPHRSLSDLLDLAFGSGTLQASMDGAWEALYVEYCRWRQTIDRTAAPYFDRHASVRLPRPLFDTPEWWSCMISERLQNFELATRRHGSDITAPPEDLSYMPEYEQATAAV